MTDSSTFGERAEVSGTQLVQLSPEQLQAMLQAAGRAAAEETLKSLRDSDAIPTNRLPASASAGRPTRVAFCGVSGALLLHLWVVLGFVFLFCLSGSCLARLGASQLGTTRGWVAVESVMHVVSGRMFWCCLVR